MENKRRKCFEMVENQKDVHVNNNSLPEEVLIQIFQHLSFSELCRVGRVCRTWYETTRSPLFWKRIATSASASVLKLVEVLPSCVTYIELNFDNTPEMELNFQEFRLKLRDRCPILKALILRCVRLTVSESPRDLYLQLPECVRVFVLHCCEPRRDAPIQLTDSDVSNEIEILDFSRCTKVFDWSNLDLSNLKKLRLAGCPASDLLLESNLRSIVSIIEILDLEDTMAGPITFKTICKYSDNLTELYMCNTFLSDGDILLIQSENALQCLKLICLCNSHVTNAGIALLIQSCQSLEHIYVGKFDQDCSQDNPESQEFPEKVHIIHGIKYCDHFNKIDYMFE